VTFVVQMPTTSTSVSWSPWMPSRRIMRPQLWKQLPLGARVVSNDFAMGDWKPDRTVRVETPGRTYTLYLWTTTQDIKNRAGAASIP
jgi:hypothetical protein